MILMPTAVESALVIRITSPAIIAASP